MTVGEEDYPPPPTHRRPLSEPPDPGLNGGADLDRHATDPVAAPWFDSDEQPEFKPVTPPESEELLGRPRMPNGAFKPPGHSSTAAHPPPLPAAQVSAVRPAPAGVRDAGPESNPLDALRSGPLPVVVAVVALVAAAALIGWLFRGTGGGQEITIGDSADAGQGVGQDDAGSVGAGDALPPLSPATLPAANEDGLVGLELALIDPYTGTGSTGSAELYLNAMTGQVCHLFDSPALQGRYRAYIHEAEFPRAGPIVVDLGEVANAVPRCVNASPIEVTRALVNGEGFYVAAHSGDREIQLRAQLSSASTVFDNRDPALVAGQEAAQGAAEAEGDVGLFGSADEGAYLVVESGRVSFEGMVPDEATANQLRTAFIALSGMGVDVVDNLMVQAGAPAPSGKVIVADALLFGSGQDQISGDPAVLATLADLMIVNPAWTMTITGHTDDVGDYAFNIELSLRRANNIRGRLAELGVPAERIRVQGAGPEQPIADNGTEEGRSSNRRIEIGIDS